MAVSKWAHFKEPPENWLFPKQIIETTPSRADNIEENREKRYRRECASFIKKVGQALKMHSNVYNTGIVFFHRFFMLNSFKHFDRWILAIASLFVAGKVGEQPKKLKDVLPAVAQFFPKPLTAEQFPDMRTRILGHERVLLASLCFDMSVEQPARFLFQYAKRLKVQGSHKIPNELVQKAFHLIDDSYKTTVCVEFPPNIIAISMLHLATKFYKGKYQLKPIEEPEESPPSKNWWESFVDTDISPAMNYISNRVLDIYDTRTTQTQAATKTA